MFVSLRKQNLFILEVVIGKLIENGLWDYYYSCMQENCSLK